MRSSLAVLLAMVLLGACSKSRTEAPAARPNAPRRPAGAAVAQSAAQPTAYSYTVVRHETPKQMIADSTTVVKVRIQNTSTRAWARDSQVRLGYYWLDQAGKRVPKGQGHRRLPKDMPVKESGTFNSSVKAPKAPGSYTLVFDMMEREPRVWFGSKGAKPLKVPVLVR